MTPSSFTRLLCTACLILTVGSTLAEDPILATRKGKRKKMEARAIYKELLAGTCWIRVRTVRSVHSGTGWILDVKRRLVVTNHHVVNGRIDMRIYFPEYEGTGDERRVITDPKHYTVQKARSARIINSSLHYDLALLQLDNIPKGMKALPIASRSAFPADKLHIVGGKPKGSDGLWTYGFGACRAVNKQRIATGSVIRILQTQGGSDHGNSGGAVLNDYGEVVGVVEGARADAKDVGMSIDVMELRNYLKKTLPQVPEDTFKGYMASGRAHYEEKRYTRAIRDFTSALGKEPQSSVAFAARGWANLKGGWRSLASKDFDQALAIDAKSVRALHGRGVLRRGKKQFSEALADATAALALDESSSNLINFKGNCLFSLKRYTEALKEFRRASVKDPNNGIVWANIGSALKRMKKYTEALPAFEKAIRLKVNVGQVWLDKGICHFHNGDLKESYNALNSAIRKRPNDAAIHFWMGNCFFARKNHQLAISSYTKSISLSATPVAHFQRGRSYAELANHKAAITDLDKAVEANPKSVVFLFHRGISRFALKDVKGFKEDMSEVVKIDPANFGFVKEAIKKGSPPDKAPDFDLSSEIGFKQDPKIAASRRTIRTPAGRTTSRPRISAIDGTWKFSGLVGKTPRRYTLTLGNAKFSLVEELRNEKGKYKKSREESGAFFSSSSSIFFRGQRVVTRKYFMRNGKLVLEFRDLGYRLPFRKIK